MTQAIKISTPVKPFLKWAGGKSTLRPLEETFNYIDYTLNLKMASSGLLSEIQHLRLL